jgi:hypothetical protein
LFVIIFSVMFILVYYETINGSVLPIIVDWSIFSSFSIFVNYETKKTKDKKKTYI